MSQSISILIADDHPLFRVGLRNIIETVEEYRIVKELDDGENALQFIEKEKPMLAILDVNMPRKNGLHVAADVQKNSFQTKLIFLTMHSEEDIFNRAMDIGVLGYVLKENATADILHCIASVANGDSYISPTLMKHLWNRKKTMDEKLNEPAGISSLTETERKVLKLISEEKSTKVIAAELFVSYKTIENHRANICQKLNVHGTNALFRYALENKSLL